MSSLALVTGATGFMAHHLIPALTGAGWDVRATARRERPDWLDPAVAYTPADLTADPLEPLCDGASVIFHLAGATSSLSSPEEMHQSNVVATGRLVAAALAAGSGRLVHMGSTSVYGEEVPLPQPLVESVQPHPSRGYGKAKWQAEEQIWASVPRGLDAVILRPVSVFGPGAVKLLASALLDVAIERHAGLGTVAVHDRPVELRLVHVADVVAAARHLAEVPTASGRAFNLVAPWYPTSLELAGVMAGLAGMTVHNTPEADCGLPLAERQATWDALVAGGMQPDILFTAERFRFLKKANRNNRLSVDALLATGFRFAYGDRAGVTSGIAGTVDWYRGRRWLP